MRAIIFLIGASFLAIGPAAAEWPDLLKAAIERADTGPDYAFDIEHLETSTDRQGMKETEAAYARLDLSRPPLKQLIPAHLLDDNMPGSSYSTLASLERTLEDGIWCSRFSKFVPEDVKLAAEDGETVTYAFRPLPDSDQEGPQEKIANRSEARLTVSKTDPAVLSFSRSLTRSVSVFVVARIRRVDIDVQCERAGDGRTYAASFSSAFEISGAGPGGTSETQTRVTAIYDAAS